MVKQNAEKIIIWLSRDSAIEHVWETSTKIRRWYENEHAFDLDDYTRAEYRAEIGEIVASILADGIADGIIEETKDGEYYIERVYNNG